MDTLLVQFEKETPFKRYDSPGFEGSIFWKGIEISGHSGEYIAELHFGPEGDSVIAEGAAPKEAYSNFLKAYEQFIEGHRANLAEMSKVGGKQ